MLSLQTMGYLTIFGNGFLIRKKNYEEVVLQTYLKSTIRKPLKKRNLVLELGLWNFDLGI